MAKQRRTFTSEFKVEAIKLVTDHGRSLAENLLRKWKQALAAAGAQAFPGRGHAPALEEELHRLRAENKRLQMDRDILKKATAFFGRESS